jgi:hypothetical protein
MVPAGQGWQADKDVAPTEVEKFPGGQDVQTVDELAPTTAE